MYKTFKKLIVKENGERNILQEVLIEQISEENLRTLSILRERPAEPKEISLFESGYGRFIKF